MRSNRSRPCRWASDWGNSRAQTDATRHFVTHWAPHVPAAHYPPAIAAPVAVSGDEDSMQLLSPAIAFLRAHQLTRQLRVLTLREIGQASRSEYPHLYGTSPEARYLPWGQGTGAGYERARSDNPEVALRGIALW